MVSIVLVLLGCQAQPPAATNPQTSAPTRGCAVEREVAQGRLGPGWVSPSGTLYAMADGAPRVREADGTWSIESGPPDLAGVDFVTGFDDDHVWAAAGRDVFTRRSDGVWDRFYTLNVDVEGLYAAGPDDLWVITFAQNPCWDAPCPSELALHHWDGTDWGVLEEPHDDVTDAFPNGAGEAFAVRDSELFVVPGDVDVPVPNGRLRVVRAAPDGTIAAIQDRRILLGDRSGLYDATPTDVTAHWRQLLVHDQDDVWVFGGSGGEGELVHWNGRSWAHVGTVPESRLELAGGGGEVFLLGGGGREVAYTATRRGVVLDRAIRRPGALTLLAVDDVTGQVWARGARGVFTETDRGWRRQRGLGLERARALHASDGRLLVASFDELVFWDGVDVEVEPQTHRLAASAAAAGVFFVAASDQGDRIHLRVNDGRWRTLTNTGLPRGHASALWADGPDDLWLAIDGDVSELWRWDGATWRRQVELKRPAYWMRRMVDGDLYLAGGLHGLWRFDGTRVTQARTGDIRAAHLTPDGSWFVSSVLHGDDTVTRLTRYAPEGGAFVKGTADHVIPMVGDGDRVWAGIGDVSWSRQLCTP